MCSESLHRGKRGKLKQEKKKKIDEEERGKKLLAEIRTQIIVFKIINQ